MRLRILQIVSVVILFTIVQVGFAHPDNFSSNSITYFPDDEWTATPPEEQQMDSTVLDEMMQFIEDSETPIHGLVVTRNGYIVKEGYWSYYTLISTHHIFSCTKSFTGTLVGIAIKEGFIDNVSQRVLDFFPDMTIENLDVRKEAMTLEHVLTMTTGLDWNEHNISYFDPDNMYNQMFGTSNPIQFFLNLPSAYDPGEHWVYTTGASHLLSAIIQEATNMTTRAFAEEYLFDPLNMTIGAWNVDSQGINNGGTQLYISPRTMAKLGLLYLNNGTWNGQEIISEEWVAQSSYPHETLDTQTGYGYQWWIGTQRGSFSARGSDGQYIFVFPEQNVVVSITANADEPGEDIHEEILQYVLNSIDSFGLSISGTWEGFLPIIGVSSVILCVVVIAVLYIRRNS